MNRIETLKRIGVIITLIQELQISLSEMNIHQMLLVNDQLDEWIKELESLLAQHEMDSMS